MIYKRRFVHCHAKNAEGNRREGISPTALHQRIDFSDEQWLPLLVDDNRSIVFMATIYIGDDHVFVIWESRS